MPLSPEDHDRLRQFYVPALDTYGPQDARSVRWSDKNNQLIRFQALFQVGDMTGGSVLDVSCGTGELYKYFLEKKIDVEYTGIDIVGEFIEKAIGRFPQAKFEAKDIFDVTGHYDFVLASGALSFKVENNADYYLSMIEKMWSLTKKALAFNMLNKQYHPDDETFAAYDPREVAIICNRLSDSVEIYTGYSPRDFTVVMRKK